jgi:hypothetical protein
MFNRSYEVLMGVSGLILTLAVIGIAYDFPETLLAVLLGVAVGFQVASVFCFFKEECK